MTKTNPKIEIKLLADCPHLISNLVKLWINEIGKKWDPKTSVEEKTKVFLSHLNKESLPLTYVATYENELVAAVSLRHSDGLHRYETPWLASLVVDPAYRKQGIGCNLISYVKRKAKEMGFTELYLFAFERDVVKWYKN